jgi:hypothetical protein
MKAPVLSTLIVALRGALLKSYRTQLGQLGVKGKKLGDLEAGFEDGMGAMIHALVEAQIIEIVKPPEGGQ